MMEANASRPARKVGIADHLWDTFEEMAQAMGADRDALINQAMFTFARLNGFLEAGAARGATQGAAKAAPPVLHPVSGGRPPAPEVTPLPAPAPAPARASRHMEERPPAPARMDEDPARKEVAERVLETAAELERLIKGKGSEPFADEDDLGPADVPMDDGESLAPPVDEDALPEEEPGGNTSQDIGAEGEEGPILYLMTEAGEALPVTKERFVIGRGKHCDLVIQSGKVSREHAVISHDGEDFYIEDLGSSNGTWFNKQRIKRRKVEDGDEYYICSEKIQLVVR